MSLMHVPILIHIGYHKTATTWFQSHYFRMHPGVLYLDQANCHKLFVKPRSLDFDPDETYNLIVKLFYQENSSGKILVLSDEEFSGNIHSGGNGGYAPKEIANRLFDTFSKHPDTKIVVFIRNQFSIIESCYRQYVKVGGICSLRKYLFPPDEYHRRPMFSFEHFRYDKLIKYYVNLFGEQNVKVFLFEDFCKDRNGFLKNFESVLGIPGSSVQFDVDSYSNVSLPDTYLLFNRFINGFSTVSSLNYEIPFSIPKLPNIMRKFLAFIQKNGFSGRKSTLLTQDVRAYIGDYYREGNREISKITPYNEEKLREYGYPI